MFLLVTISVIHSQNIAYSSDDMINSSTNKITDVNNSGIIENNNTSNELDISDNEKDNPVENYIRNKLKKVINFKPEKYDFIRVFRIHTIDDFERSYHDFLKEMVKAEADDEDTHYYYGEYVKYIVQLCKIYRNKGLFKLFINNKSSNLKRKYFAMKSGDKYAEDYFNKYWKIIKNLKSNLEKLLDY